MAKREKPLVRPLSPFMHYMGGKTLFTMGLSILHRITGVALTAGSMVLVYWLTAAAMGAEAYAQAQEVFACWPVQAVLVGFVFSFCYHFLNGIRHLVWDTGRGFELNFARNSGMFVFFGAIAFTVLIVVLFCARVGGTV
jgi:succinate dehydrogenase / fumarate reductase cytochrome b subunit